MSTYDFINNFQHSDILVPDLSPSRSAWWIKVNVKNSKPQSKTFYLQLSNPRIDNVQLYEEDSQGRYNKKEISSLKSLNSREIASILPTFQVEIPAQKTTTYYFRITSIEPLTLSLNLSTESGFFQQNRLRLVLAGGILGILLVMMFYHLFYWVILRNKEHLWYVVTMFCVILFVTFRESYILDLFPDSEFDPIVWAIFFSFTVILCNVSFILTFLNSRELHPKIWKWVVLSIIPSSVALLTPFVPREFTWDIYSFFIAYTSCSFFVVLIAAFHALSQRKTIDISSLLAGQVIIIFAGALELLSGLGLIKKTIFIENILAVSFCLMSFFFALALAFRVKRVREEKELAQQSMLDYLEQVDRLKDLFLSNSSKELKEPLQGLIKVTESLEQLSLLKPLKFPSDILLEIHLIFLWDMECTKSVGLAGNTAVQLMTSTMK